jgi:hypothetical protein
MAYFNTASVVSTNMEGRMHAAIREGDPAGNNKGGELGCNNKERYNKGLRRGIRV